MPDGRTHRLINRFGYLLAAPVLIYNPELGLGVITGVWLGDWFNPDNDLTVRRIPFFFRMFGFTLYKDLVKHRAGIRKKDWKQNKWWKWFVSSHLPITGTLLRWGMLMILPALISGYYNYWPYLFYLGIYIGLCITDTLHVAADLIVSELQ